MTEEIKEQEQLEEKQPDEQQEQQEEKPDEKLIDQETFNKAVTDRLAREKKKWEKSIDDIVAEKLNEKQRLSELSDEEIKAEQLTDRERQLAEREAAIKKNELLTETETVLRDRKLPASFASFLVTDDNDTTLENVKGFQDAFNEAVKTAVKNELTGQTPKAGASNKTGTHTRASIAAVKDPVKRNKLIRENPHLYGN